MNARPLGSRRRRAELLPAVGLSGTLTGTTGEGPTADVTVRE
ncbi:hypothetical protein [Streptomyces dangxiongensis]|nr:hypothetical protein [Streptomyces dangxiongensis]